MSLARRLAPLLIAPALLAWSGGGSGTGVWEDGRGDVRSVNLSGLVETGGSIRVVVNANVADGEALIFVTVPNLYAGRRVSALDEGVEVSYREYAADGRVRFAAEGARDGWIEVSASDRHVTLELDASWYDPRVFAHRHWSGVFLRVRAPDQDPAQGEVEVHGSASAGCDTTVEPEPYDDSSGCEGDDWESDDDWGDDSGGGCEGDDLGGSDGYDDSGGCEGDDLGDSGGDTSASCEGDAIASAGPVRRSPTIVRLINQLPWLLVVIGLRLGRRRRR